MSVRRWIVAAALAAVLGDASHGLAPTEALAQTRVVPGAQSSSPYYARPRIQINPRPPLYRRCVDWYELQYRPSGTVLYPQMRCWWVRA
jgi:hypothetical protein